MIEMSIKLGFLTGDESKVGGAVHIPQAVQLVVQGEEEIWMLLVLVHPYHLCSVHHH